jgi:hypothetical protein
MLAQRLVALEVLDTPFHIRDGVRQVLKKRTQAPPEGAMVHIPPEADAPSSSGGWRTSSMSLSTLVVVPTIR